MTLAVGDTLPGSHRLTEPYAPLEGAWRAIGPDGASVIVAPADIAECWPESLFHPALVPWRPLAGAPGWCIRADLEASTPRPDSVRRVFALGGRLAEALAVLHGAGLAHGNVGANSIVAGADGRPRLIDAMAAGDAASDIAALGRFLASLLGADASADDRALLAATAEEGWPALELRDRLDDARLAGHAAPVAPASVRVSGDAAPPPVEDVGEARRRWVGGAIAASVLAIILTVWLLPGGDQPPVTPTQVVEEPVVEPEPAPEPPTEEELAALLEQRQRTQTILDEFINLQLAQEERAVERWGQEAFDAAVAIAREAETPFRAQDYATAETLYGEALAAMEDVAAQGDAALAGALADGAAALAAGDSAAAKAAFELALAIDPEEATAQAGLARAGTLDEAFALRARAEDAENGERFEEALGLYGELLALDPAMPGIAAAPGRIRAAIEDRDFRQAMSDGLAALEIGAWGQAKGHFERAAGMRPNDPAPGEFIAEAERRSRDFVLGSHRRKASEAMASEDWDAAIAHYEAILKREPNARVATDGLADAQAQGELYGSLERYVQRPENWWSDRGRVSARELLTRAGEVDGERPRLAALRLELARLLALAEQPVAVTLRSDNACEVVVYKVARLGSFQERTLELKPGRYTAVATRNGYRDVRKEFLVPAGGQPAPVNLICEEPV